MKYLYIHAHIYCGPPGSSKPCACMTSCMMSERHNKLRKLEGVRRRVPYVSQSALHAILAEVDRCGVPELHQRTHMREASRLALQQCSLYGPLLLPVKAARLRQEGDEDLLLVNALSLLAGAYEQGGSYTELLQGAHAAVPSAPDKPWRFILYLDEVVPGNVLSHRQERKCWVAYAAFAEFGVHLMQEPAWLILGIFRSHKVATLSAGISQVANIILKQIFKGPVRPQAGLVLKCPMGRTLRLYFELGMFLQDGAAQKHVFGIKGDAGSRFCMLCMNAMTLRSALDVTDMDDEHAFAGVCGLLRHQDLHLCSDADVLQSADRLAGRVAAGVPKAQIALWEQASGINFQEHGLLFDRDLRDVLRPCSQFAHDWMHATCSNGTLTLTLFLLLSCLQKAGVPAWQAVCLGCTEYILHISLPFLARTTLYICI